jgi:hypothetical protein
MTAVRIICGCCPAVGDATELRMPSGQLRYGFLPAGWIEVRRPHGPERLCSACAARIADAYDDRRPAIEARIARHGADALPEIAALVGVPIDLARRWCAAWGQQQQQERTAA